MPRVNMSKVLWASSYYEAKGEYGKAQQVDLWITDQVRKRRKRNRRAHPESVCVSQTEKELLDPFK